MQRRTTVVIAAFAVVILAASLVAALSYFEQVNQSNILRTKYDNVISGYRLIVGNGTASDGLLKITVNSYRLELGGNILFQASGANSTNGTVTTRTTTSNYIYGSNGEMYLLLNVTFQNIGSGAAPIGPGFAEITNGTSTIGNGELMGNVSFPGEFPNASLPANRIWGGENLPAGSSSTVWLLFYIYGVNPNQASNFVMKQFSYLESGYGGTYVGNGAYTCPCESPMVEFIILPVSS